VFEPNLSWEDRQRDDIIYYNEEKPSKDLMDNLKIGKEASQEARNAIVSVLKDHWDCFAKEGVRRTILGYQFSRHWIQPTSLL